MTLGHGEAVLWGPSLDPPPISRSQTDGGRTGNKSGVVHNSDASPEARGGDMGAYLRLMIRLRHAAGDEERHAVDRRLRRLTRAGIGQILTARVGELADSYLHPKRDLWSRLARRFGSCEYVKPIRNALSGTVIGFPYSCRVPGCPHCERERVDRLRERYLPYVERARRPKVAYLTMPHTIAGVLVTGPDGLAPSWQLLADAWGRLWRSPLFQAVDRKGNVRRCRPGRVGCLAGLGERDMEIRRWCRGRCQRPDLGGWRRPDAKGAEAKREGSVVAVSHPTCRPCTGHEPVTAAILALEATINRKTRQWHPHANLLLDGPWIDQDLLCWAWGRALGVGKAHTWIRDASKPPAGHKGETWTREKALFETVKYAVKPDDALVDPARPAWYVEWVEARDGRRLVRSVGEWYGLDDEAADDEPEGAEPTVSIIDADSGRRYVLPAIDPLTDEPADWEPIPGDMLRARFAQVLPPGAGRRRWLVSHEYARFGADVDPPDG